VKSDDERLIAGLPHFRADHPEEHLPGKFAASVINALIDGRAWDPDGAAADRGGPPGVQRVRAGSA
jgi:hypothetical protein